MNVTTDGFADVIDETQLSLELYFYARELNRADHIQMGLAPPGTGLLPPGEAHSFYLDALSKEPESETLAQTAKVAGLDV